MTSAGRAERASARQLRWAAGAAALLLAGAAGLIAAPQAGECVVRSILGFDCPGCGLGRALTALGELDAVRAVWCYPPLPALGVLYLGALAAMLARARGRSARGWLRLCAGCGVLSAIAVLGSWTVGLALG